jgi:hypothetical protein
MQALRGVNVPIMLAVRHRGRLVIFDTSVPREAVKGAEKIHLRVL